MKNYVQRGKTMEYTVADNAVKSGEIVVVGAVAGVAVTDGEIGETITLDVMGVFELPKGSGALTQGQKAYVNVSDEGAKTIVGTDTGNTFCGYVWEAAAAGASTVLVRLN
jgi:predicted RecA/RadA family phage recombinase